MSPRPSLAALALGLAFALAACGDEKTSAPGGVSPGEAKALEDAASMLDERKLPPEAIPSDASISSSTAKPAAAPAEATGDALPAAR